MAEMMSDAGTTSSLLLHASAVPQWLPNHEKVLAAGAMIPGKQGMPWLVLGIEESSEGEQLGIVE